MPTFYKRVSKVAAMATLVSYLAFEVCYGLSVLPASQNPLVKRIVLQAIMEKATIHYAMTDEDTRLLEYNGSPYIMLSTGEYLARPGAHFLDLLNFILRKETSILMTAMARDDRAHYEQIAALVRGTFPGPDGQRLPDEAVGEIVGKGFAWYILLNGDLGEGHGYVYRYEIPPEEKAFVSAFSAMVRDHSDIFKQDSPFFDTETRRGIIKRAVDAPEYGITLYRVPDVRQKIWSAGREGYLVAGKKFIAKREAEGIVFECADAYAEIVAGILFDLNVKADRLAEDPDAILIDAFKRNDIKRILELGCGRCDLLAALQPLAKEAGCSLSGVDRNIRPSAGIVARRVANANVVLKSTEITDFESDEGFDLVIASGVMSLNGTYPAGKKGMDLEGLRTACANAGTIARKAVTLLSHNPQAAFITNSYRTVLMAYQGTLAEFADVVIWDTARSADFSAIYNGITGTYGKAMWAKINEQSARFTLLTRKESFYKEHTEEMLDDVLRRDMREKRTYTIKYDTARLSHSQGSLIEEYCRLLERHAERTGSPVEVKLRPFNSGAGGKESLIAVYCAGENFTGEGHVDIDKGVDPAHYLLRLSIMLNIAFAASNIPAGAAGDQALTPRAFDIKYGHIVRFIERQYRIFTGKSLGLPQDVSGIVAAIQRVNMELPPIYKLPLKLIEEYNERAQLTLRNA
ncbi:MAG: class I SAM-dependent methyltransferase [Candidatus Omnitrophica bacterium]|nr:class I SAM-dependent methyltransferase [Candidatus Omnitrophota bacterium]